MSEVFRVIAEDSKGQRYTVRHLPSGLGAGGFWYRRFAVAAAKAMNAVVAQHPALATAEGANDRTALAALLATRKPHSEADHAQMVEREQAKREAKGRR